MKCQTYLDTIYKLALKKYNEISNDTEFKNKIVSHFSDKRIYERIDSEIKAREVTVEVSDINDLGEKSCKISIVYTFDGIAVAIDGVRDGMKFLISTIKMENKFIWWCKIKSKYKKNNILYI